MTAMAASRLNPSALNQGMPALARFCAYVGAIAAITGYALYGGDGYAEQGLLHFLGAPSLAWIGSGALAGLLGGLALGMVRPESAQARLPARLTPWLDGLMLMILLAAAEAMFEPASVTYNDQSGLVSGRVIMTMNIALLASALLYLTHLFAPAAIVGRLATATA